MTQEDHIAIQLAGGLEKWRLLPSFADHFTNGRSHEELRAKARQILQVLAKITGHNP